VRADSDCIALPEPAPSGSRRGSPPPPVIELLRELVGQRVILLVGVRSGLVLFVDIVLCILRTHRGIPLLLLHRLSPVIEMLLTKGVELNEAVGPPDETGRFAASSPVSFVH
jgi:hypothetical protein